MPRKPKKHQFVVLDSLDEAQEPVALLRSKLLEADIPEALAAMEATAPVTAQVLHSFEEAGRCRSIACRCVKQ